MKQENSEGRKEGIISCNSCGKLCFNSCPNCNNGMFKMDLIEQNKPSYSAKNFVSSSKSSLYGAETKNHQSPFSNHIHSPAAKQFIENNDFILGGGKDITSLDLLINCDNKLPTPKRKDNGSMNKNNILGFNSFGNEGLFGNDINMKYQKSQIKQNNNSPDFVFSNTFDKQNNNFQNNKRSPPNINSQYNQQNFSNFRPMNNYSQIMSVSPSLNTQINPILGKTPHFKQQTQPSTYENYNRGMMNYAQVSNAQPQGFYSIQSASRHKMMQQFSKTQKSTSPPMLNEQNKIEIMKQKMPRLFPSSSKSHLANGRNNVISVVVDMNLSPTADNLMNLLNIKPVDYSCDVDQEIAGMYMKKRHNSLHKKRFD